MKHKRTAIVASIRPRHRSRGDYLLTQSLVARRSFNSATASKPWRLKAGLVERLGEYGFNSATASKPWRRHGTESIRCDQAASIRPRHRSRGDAQFLAYGFDDQARFNSATASKPWRPVHTLAPWRRRTGCNSATASKPWRRSQWRQTYSERACFNSATASKPWRRHRGNSETNRVVASIRPRHRSRGDRPAQQRQEEGAGASIRPRHRSRGDGDKPEPGPMGEHSF